MELILTNCPRIMLATEIISVNFYLDKIGISLMWDG